MTRLIIKIVRQNELKSFQDRGQFSGSADDLRDGFIHLSTPVQVRGTLKKHFSTADDVGEAGLSMMTFDCDALEPNLKWEKSRDGALFPHHYGALSLDMVKSIVPLDVDDDGQHVIPENFPDV